MNVFDFAHWNSKEAFANHGEEWSTSWGGSAMQWLITIYPRIAHMLPCRNILEIAPGHGRFTNYLRVFGDTLVGVDVAQDCVSSCKSRFAEHAEMTFHVGNGFSLDMVDDESIDFAFSYDSLVHCSDSVMESYVKELKRVLRPGASGFIHHSNLGECPTCDAGQGRHPRMTAKKFRGFCNDAQLGCVAQELFNWGDHVVGPIDCYSWIKKTGVPLNTRVVSHNDFATESALARRISALVKQ